MVIQNDEYRNTWVCIERVKFPEIHMLGRQLGSKQAPSPKRVFPSFYGPQDKKGMCSCRGEWCRLGRVE